MVINTSVFCQEWSKEQNEVWENIENFYSLIWEQKDIEGFLSYVHDDYQGWDYTDPVPGNKESLKKLLVERVPKREILVYYLNPLSIQVYGNVAFSHYYSTRIIMNKGGVEKLVKTRWTDILLKEGDKWVLIGDRSEKVPEQ